MRQVEAAIKHIMTATMSFFTAPPTFWLLVVSMTHEG
jgi:hypothetical protein